jgi:hypothetical protein
MKEKYNLKPSRTAGDLELSHKKAQSRAVNPEYIKRNSGPLKFLKDMIQAFTVKPFNEHRLSQADKIHDMYLQEYGKEIYKNTLNRLDSEAIKDKELAAKNTMSKINDEFEKAKIRIMSSTETSGNPEIAKTNTVMLEALEELREIELAKLDKDTSLKK